MPELAAAPTKTESVAMQPDIESAAHALASQGQEAVETRCLAAMQALAEKDGKIALETLLQTNKYQMQATGEFTIPEKMQKDIAQNLWVKTDCGDPDKLARITLANLSKLPGNKGAEHLVALERCLGFK
mmetsp:Transcript_58999/g.95370  ORF Transcript_58999/g.95370 Transcript_58999/m.95370 type:complete len:129 (-) Transcript_58999:479-865(-)